MIELKDGLTRSMQTEDQVVAQLIASSLWDCHRPKYILSVCRVCLPYTILRLYNRLFAFLVILHTWSAVCDFVININLYEPLILFGASLLLFLLLSSCVMTRVLCRHLVC